MNILLYTKQNPFSLLNRTNLCSTMHCATSSSPFYALHLCMLFSAFFFVLAFSHKLVFKEFFFVQCISCKIFFMQTILCTAFLAMYFIEIKLWIVPHANECIFFVFSYLVKEILLFNSM